MTLRERERFLKLSDEDVDDCNEGEVGWLTAWESESNGAIFEMTTDRSKTLQAIYKWGEEHKDEVGEFVIETDGKFFAFVQDHKPMTFDQVMNILNNFR